MWKFCAAAILFVAVAGCSNEPDAPRGGLAYMVDSLPADFPEQPLFLCLTDQTADRGVGFFSGYRGTVHVDSEVYTETPFLRFGKAPSQITLKSWVRLSQADEGSERALEVNGTQAIAFTMSTAEPVITPWPAIVWYQDGITLTMFGEGMSEAEVLEAAESVRRATSDELATGGFVGQEQCE